MGALYHRLVFIIVSICSLIVPRQSFSAKKKTEKNEHCVYFVAILASKDRIFFFHHFSLSSSSDKPSSHPNHILYGKYAKTLKA